MALFGGREELVEENIRLKVKVEYAEDQLEQYKQRVSSLEEQVARLQDALIAKEAPQAYRDARADREPERELTPEEQKAMERRYKQGLANRRLLELIEDDTFPSVDHMVRSFTGVSAEELLDRLESPRTVGVPATESVHANEES